MAEEVLKKLEEGLNCSICLDTYTDPKLLQCFHTYCRKCLVPLVDRNQQGQLGLTCPICRQVTPIPERGVAGLQPAFHINHLLEIQDSVKKLDNPAVALEGAVGGATIAATNAASSTHAVKHCREHLEKEVDLYCGTCRELVCYKCVIRGGKHQNHDYKEIDQAFLEYKEWIVASVEPMEKQVTTISKALALLDARCGEISDQQAANKDKVHATFKRLREVLDVRETELIGQLDGMTQSKLKGLAAQRDQIETTLTQLNSCLYFMGESLKTGNKLDMLMMKMNTEEQVKELTTPFPPDYLKPNTEANIAFSSSAEMVTACGNYGYLALDLLDPSKCYAKGFGLELAVVGEKSTSILHAINSDEKPCEQKIKSLECQLLSEITGTKAGCSVERRGLSQYEISYQPTIKGRHQLHIKVEGQQIRGSPFSVTVTAPVEKLGPPILTIRGVNKPWGVAITPKREVVVSEYFGHRVSVFSPRGEKLRSFGAYGSGQGQLQYPAGVAVDGECNILVADQDNHRIQKFTLKGQFVTAVGKVGKQVLQFLCPRGITFNASNGKVYVMDSGNNRCQVLNSDLTFFSTFGKTGTVKEQFTNPWGVACDSTGKVYVADRGNHRIQVFTAEGVFLRMFGRRGQGAGELDFPVGVAIDSNDMVYVSEASNRHVSVFTSEGQFVTSFGGFKMTYGLAVDTSGVVYVSAFNKNCITLH